MRPGTHHQFMRIMTALPMCLVIAGPLVAQEAVPQLAPGDWVRISTRISHLDPNWRVGALATITATYVVIEPIGQAPLAIPHRTVTRFQLQSGWQSRRAKGGAVGGIAGLLVSALAYALIDCGAACFVGVPVGAVAGYTIGGTLTSIRWESIPPSRIRPHNIAQARPVARLGLLSVRF